MAQVSRIQYNELIQVGFTEEQTMQLMCALLMAPEVQPRIVLQGMPTTSLDEILGKGPGGPRGH